MTIDEAIKHAKEQTDIFGGNHGEFLVNVAEWLEDYKRINKFNDGYYKAGYTKAIDDFAEMMCVKSEELSCTTTINGMPVDILTLDGTTETIFEVAEQLKEGSADNE